MTTLTLKPTTQKGLGCLNGLSCPECNAPMVDTLSEKPMSKIYKACFCPMCDYTGTYQRYSKAIQ